MFNLNYEGITLDLILTSDEGFRVYESEVILDVSYNCLESYVPYPETGMYQKGNEKISKASNLSDGLILQHAPRK